VTVPTTTTSTTTSPPPLGQHLSITTAVGTSDCTINPSNGEPAAPFSGELDSDTVGSKITDLGRGCLYVGSGVNTATGESTSTSHRSST
jgi:hypothetical protein